MAKSMKPGGGGRFAKLKGQLAHEKGISNPGAVAAAIGRKKYGNAKFQHMAAVGKKRAEGHMKHEGMKHAGEKHEHRGLHHGGGRPENPIERPEGGRGHIQDGLKMDHHAGKGLKHHNVVNAESHAQKLMHS